jgi:GNAT superfamily N-acetyltransferase
VRSNQPGQGLIRVQRLTASARAEIEALAVACKEHEPGLDLPLYLAPTRRAGGETTLIHCYDDDVLVGLANLTPGDEVEVVGMVHPAQRRKGIGRALLDAVRQACQLRGASSLTLVCEAAAPSGQAFAAAVGAAYRYAEHRMALDRAPVCRWSCRVGVGVTPLWAGGQPMIEELLRIYGANRTNPGAPACTFAETLIFNEGWLLRGVLRAWRS